MARYYESKTLIEFVKKYTPHINGETTKECVERAIREAPTADVVPKSEVDLYRRQVDELEDELATTYDKLEKAKTDVAREIFEEIEEIFKKRIAFYTDMAKQSKFTEKHYAETMIKNCEIYLQEIAELKKKYIGEKE